MRLLKTESSSGYDKLEFVGVWGAAAPKYAILSHLWSRNPDDEVLFADVQNGTYKAKPAFVKVRKSLELAKRDGYEFLWCDTCCIDKTSSAELSEAINSMYRYYQLANVCYAFLADVDADRKGFETSRWWRRGFTLQELLAPAKLEFFSQDWSLLGSKVDLQASISRISGIDIAYLTGARSVHDASIARRMSWAAERETSREEDIAYSLMGIFQVNMPMLYGEGSRKAFIRLQEEIMKDSEDQSIFAWIDAECQEGSHHGLLADSPRHFKQTGDVIPYSEPPSYSQPTFSIDRRRSTLPEYSQPTITARGLLVTLPLTLERDGTCYVALQCPVPERGYSGWLAVYLERLSNDDTQYARIEPDQLGYCWRLGQPRSIYIRQNVKQSTQTVYPTHQFQLKHWSVPLYKHDLPQYRIVKMKNWAGGLKPPHFQDVPGQPWSTTVPRVIKIDKRKRALTAALLVTRRRDTEAFVLMLGADAELDIAFHAVEANELGTFEALQEAYSPQPLGSRIKLKHHSVRVTANEWSGSGHKVYYLHVEIELTPSSPEPVAKMLEVPIDTLTVPRQVTQGDGKGKRSKWLWNALKLTTSG